MAGDYYVGLMSGTSMDAVDAVLVEIEEHQLRHIAHATSPLPAKLKSDLEQLALPGNDHLDLYGTTDITVGQLFAKTVLKLLDQAGIHPTAVAAIGSHGQTIRHRPPEPGCPKGFTIQIGDPNTIAAGTGITTVADFRRKDMALGGQGAPLVPAFHHYRFRDPLHNRAIINIGGIANITGLPAGDGDSAVIGFDTGPGNGLMDAWIRRHRNTAYDQNGAWAASGQVNPLLLAALMDDDYLRLPPPKSTGREYFNINWLDARLDTLASTPSPADVQATLCAFTVETIARGLNSLPAPCSDIYLCGGGAYNTHLIASLQHRLPSMRVATCASLGIAPEHVEATAFAWLAYRTLNRLPGSLNQVTGASRPAILGGIFLP